MEEIILEEVKGEFKETAEIFDRDIVFISYEDYNGKWRDISQFSVSKENFKKIAEALEETT